MKVSKNVKKKDKDVLVKTLSKHRGLATTILEQTQQGQSLCGIRRALLRKGYGEGLYVQV